MYFDNVATDKATGRQIRTFATEAAYQSHMAKQ